MRAIATNTATFPPFVSESAASRSEEREIRAALPRLNVHIGSKVFVDFYVTHDSGLPQFKYVVDESAWNGLDADVRHGLVRPGGILFNQTRAEYRRYHRGRICLGSPDNNLMLDIVNQSRVSVGLDFMIFAASSEC
jgi:hypothetical protein